MSNIYSDNIAPKLILNILESDAQYESILSPSSTEIYLTPDNLEEQIATKQNALTTKFGVEINNDVISSTIHKVTFKDDTTIPTQIVFNVNVPTLYYTSATNSTLTFDTFQYENQDLEDGVYTWELICSTNQAIASTTLGTLIQYVGNDKIYNPSLAFPLIDNQRTANVFSVRLIRNNNSDLWMVAYNYSFKG